MLQKEHSAILLTFIKLLFVNMTFVLSIFEWSFYTGFTVQMYPLCHRLFVGREWSFFKVVYFNVIHWVAAYILEDFENTSP